MLSETNRLDSYTMKAKILSTYFGKLEDYNSQTNEMEEDRTVMDLTYSTNSTSQQQEEDDRTRPSQSYTSSHDEDNDNQTGSGGVLRVLPHHHHGLLSLPPGPSNYRTVIQHIPTTTTTLHPSGMITVLPEHHQQQHHHVTSASVSRHQPSPGGSIHSLESHPSASSSPSLNSECYKSAAGNYSGSEAGGSGSVVSSSRKKKKQPQPIPEECKDDAYWERRKRNNESAKRSREIRRMKEHHTSIRVVFLEQENLQLRTEVNMLREEVEKLRNLLCSKGSNNNGAAS